MMVVLFLVNLFGWISFLTLVSLAILMTLVWIGSKIIERKAIDVMKSDSPESR
jgi:hypothetical protein